MQTVMLYAQVCTHSSCANCVRMKYVEALRLAHRQIQDEGSQYNKVKLEEYALNHIKPDIKCFEFAEFERLKKLEDMK